MIGKNKSFALRLGIYSQFSTDVYSLHIPELGTTLFGDIKLHNSEEINTDPVGSEKYMAGAVPAPVTVISVETQLHLYTGLLITVPCIGFEVVKDVLSV